MVEPNKIIYKANPSMNIIVFHSRLTIQFTKINIENRTLQEQSTSVNKFSVTLENYNPSVTDKLLWRRVFFSQSCHRCEA